ncbi:MAG: hypothetical protein KGJ90_04145 [Patescibacteria group bacterium]|nr:hypothetical protein [Patescibacteria group bacterium]
MTEEESKELWGTEPSENSVADMFKEDVEGENKSTDEKTEDETGEKTQDDSKNEEEKKVDDTKELELIAKNRQKRRWLGRIQSEKETNAALSERLRLIEESQKSRKESGSAEIERIFGNNTPEGQEATAILLRKLEEIENRAVDKALEKFRDEQLQQVMDVKKEEDLLEDMLEEIEEIYPEADFSNRDTRRAFLDRLERMSPKDSNGDIIEYADPHAVWEDYAAGREKSKSRAKDLAARGMSSSAGAAASQEEVKKSELEAEMIKQGII